MNRFKLFLAPFLLLLGVSGCAGTAAPASAPAAAPMPASAPAAAPMPASASAGPFAYVTNQDAASVSVIDLDRRELARTVDLRQFGFGPNAKPHHVAVEPGGAHWYVSLIGEGKILKFDREDRLVGQADFETPGMLALHPNEPLLLVGRSMSAVNPPPSIGVIRTSDMSLEEVEVLFPRPHALSVHPGGDATYAASLAVNQLAVIDVESETARVQEVRAHDHTMLAHSDIAPDGQTLVVTGEMSGELMIFDLADPRNPRLTRTVPVGDRPWHPAFTRDGRQVYVPLKGDDAVLVLDAGDWSTVRTIRAPGIAEPYGSAVSPDGRTVIISNSNLAGSYRGSGGEPTGTVALIDTATGEVVCIIEVGRNPTGVGAPPR